MADNSLSAKIDGTHRKALDLARAADRMRSHLFGGGNSRLPVPIPVGGIEGIVPAMAQSVDTIDECLNRLGGLLLDLGLYLSDPDAGQPAAAPAPAQIEAQPQPEIPTAAPARPGQATLAALSALSGPTA